MSTLHLLSHSPFDDHRLSSCLRLLGTDDALMLTGDAVYALLPDSTWATQLQGLQVFALSEDLAARGIQPTPQAKPLDYPGFVQCCLDFDKVNSWV